MTHLRFGLHDAQDKRGEKRLRSQDKKETNDEQFFFPADSTNRPETQLGGTSFTLRGSAVFSHLTFLLKLIALLGLPHVW